MLIYHTFVYFSPSVFIVLVAVFIITEWLTILSEWLIDHCVIPLICPFVLDIFITKFDTMVAWRYSAVWLHFYIVAASFIFWVAWIWYCFYQRRLTLTFFLIRFLFFLLLFRFLRIKFFFIIVIRIIFLWAILLHRTYYILALLIWLVTRIIFFFRWWIDTTGLDFATGTFSWSLSMSSSIRRSTLSTSSIILTQSLFCWRVSFFIFDIKLLEIWWVCYLNFDFVRNTPDLHCFIIATRSKHIWLIRRSIYCINKVAVSTETIVLYSTTRYFVEKLTCVTSPDIDGCFFTGGFTSTNDEVLIYSGERWSYVVLIWMILMLE